MKKQNFIIQIFLCFSLLSLSCTKDDTFFSWNLEGEYEGTFTVKYTNGETYSNPVKITFQGNTYISSASNDRYPAGGNGSFTIKENEVVFQDINFWTADFDWCLILNGKYKIQTNGSKIILSAQKSGQGLYQYEFSKKTDN